MNELPMYQVLLGLALLQLLLLLTYTNGNSPFLISPESFAVT